MYVIHRGVLSNIKPTYPLMAAVGRKKRKYYYYYIRVCVIAQEGHRLGI